jgi:hypothetical protein
VPATTSSVCDSCSTDGPATDVAASAGDATADDGGALDTSADGSAADGGSSSDGGGTGGPVADGLSLDSADLDGAPAVADSTASSGDADWSELLDPEDSGSANDGQVPVGPVGQLYAETWDKLYRLDLASQAFVLVGTFSFDKNGGGVTDIALDENGQLYAITNDHLFSCNVQTAACTWLAAFPAKMEAFNGLTFVPKGTVDPQAQALIGITQAGQWTRIVIAAGKVTLQQLGTYGGKWLSSGDAFSVEGIGTYATLKVSGGTEDTLAKVDPKSGKIVQIVGGTGVKGLFGLAWWSGVFYAFSSDGNAYMLDVATGKATLAANITSPQGIKWWGAGVSTRAAGKQP